MIIIWVVSSLKRAIGQLNTDAEVKYGQIKELVADFFHNANTHDILILPFIASYTQLISKIRQRGLTGPIVFLKPGIDSSEQSQRLIKDNVLILNPQTTKFHELNAIIHMLINNQLEKSEMDSKLVSMEESFQELKLKTDISSIIDGGQTSGKNAAKMSDELIEEDKANIDEFQSPDQMRSLLSSLKKKQRRILIFFDYFLRKQKKYITINLTSKLGSILEDNSFELVSISPRVNISTLLRQGITIKISFPYGSKFYASECDVRKVIKDSAINAYFPTNVTPQKRKYFRVKPSADESISFNLKGEGPTISDLNIIDISERGIAFHYSDDLSPGQHLMVSLHIKDIHLLCHGIIQQKIPLSNNTKYGIEIFPDDRDADMITKYVLRKQLEVIHEIRNDA